MHATDKLKIKVSPEDFIVEEIASLPLVTKGGFGVYLLKKQNWNTAELLRLLSKRLKLPLQVFSYGGKKDRHSLSTQYITIKNAMRLGIKEREFSLTFLGYMERPMGPDLIRGNSFKITVRKLNEQKIKRALEAKEIVDSIGYPNYFDNQRFGSFDPRQGFLAEKVLKKQYNGALKLYLTAIYPHDKKEEKERKRLFFENWKDWETCRKNAGVNFERQAFDFLCRNPRGFLNVLKSISREELSLHFSAYQSFLWNETVQRVITEVSHGPNTAYPGLIGDYIFYTQLEENTYHYLNNLYLATPGTKAKTEDTLCGYFYAQVLRSNGIKNAMFNKMKLRQFFLKSFPRKVIVKPENLSTSVLDDEIYKKGKKLLFAFSLPRGSYATMLIKRLFSS